MDGVLSLAIALALGLLVALGAAGVHRWTAPAPRATVAPFGFGLPPREHALSRFHARWYPLTLLFLAFDVEMLFMYPWAVVVAQVGTGAVVEMFVFLGVLMLAVLWAWREGALRWT